MKIAVVNSSELTSGCWDVRRFLNECQSCYRFKRCRYKGKAVSPEVQKAIDAIKALRLTRDQAQEEINRLAAEHDINLKEV